MVRKFAVALAVVAWAWTLSVRADGPIPTTVCAVATHTKDFDGQFVRFKAWLEGNAYENVFIKDPACPRDVIEIGDDDPEANVEHLDQLTVTVRRVRMEEPWDTVITATLDGTIRVGVLHGGPVAVVHLRDATDVDVRRGGPRLVPPPEPRPEGWGDWIGK